MNEWFPRSFLCPASLNHTIKGVYYKGVVCCVSIQPSNRGHQSALCTSYLGALSSLITNSEGSGGQHSSDTEVTRSEAWNAFATRPACHLTKWYFRFSPLQTWWSLSSGVWRRKVLYKYTGVWEYPSVSFVMLRIRCGENDFEFGPRNRLFSRKYCGFW